MRNSVGVEVSRPEPASQSRNFSVGMRRKSSLGSSHLSPDISQVEQRQSSQIQ